jgi:hypothetical protein
LWERVAAGGRRVRGIGEHREKVFENAGRIA